MMLYDGHTYLNRLRHALSCGRPGCPCAGGDLLHCPAHHDAHIPNFVVDGPPDNPAFTCQRGCSDENIIAALSLRSLMPPERILTATDAIEVGLQPATSASHDTTFARRVGSVTSDRSAPPAPGLAGNGASPTPQPPTIRQNADLWNPLPSCPLAPIHRATDWRSKGRTCSKK